MELPPAQGFAPDNWLELLEAIGARIKEVDARIAEEVSASEEAQLLMTVPEVGRCFGLLIASDIGDISRFPSAKHLCSYAGLVPSTRSSGGKTHYGRITKQGSHWLRWAMVEAVVTAVGRPGTIRKYYLRMKARKGTNIARVATARKLLANIYHMLKENKSFDEVMSERGFSG